MFRLEDNLPLKEGQSVYVNPVFDAGAGYAIAGADDTVRFGDVVYVPATEAQIGEILAADEKTHDLDPRSKDNQAQAKHQQLLAGAFTSLTKGFPLTADEAMALGAQPLPEK